jgi:gamma-glutamyltranspeptidase/glutathione hydrolase
MLSSMSPTFLQHGDKTAVIGTPGGSRIISMVILGALAFFEDENAQAIVDTPRYHHQYLPDKIFLEKQAMQNIDPLSLEEMGHTLSESERTWGNMQVVIFDRRQKRMQAASDKRGVGASVVIDP